MLNFDKDNIPEEIITKLKPLEDLAELSGQFFHN